MGWEYILLTIYSWVKLSEVYSVTAAVTQIWNVKELRQPLLTSANAKTLHAVTHVWNVRVTYTFRVGNVTAVAEVALEIVFLGRKYLPGVEQYIPELTFIFIDKELKGKSMYIHIYISISVYLWGKNVFMRWICVVGMTIPS